jgi:hypothetical protein
VCSQDRKASAVGDPAGSTARTSLYMGCVAGQEVGLLQAGRFPGWLWLGGEVLIIPPDTADLAWQGELISRSGGGAREDASLACADIVANGLVLTIPVGPVRALQGDLGTTDSA